MATYTAPTTRTTGALISASIWNTDIVENLKYFKDAPVFDGAVKVTGALTPATNDGSALGSGTVSWADLFLASGGVINFNNGDVTVTHSTNTLTFAGAASGYVFNDGNVGIGVTPTEKLDVNGYVLVRGTRIYQSNAGGNVFEIGPGVGTGDATIWGFLAPTSRSMALFAGQLERLRITSGGNVAIGATARLYFDGTAGSGDTYIHENSSNVLITVVGGTNLFASVNNPTKYNFSYEDFVVDSGKKLYLDGLGDTYLSEAAANIIRVTVGGVSAVQWDTTGMYLNTPPPTTASAANAFVGSTADYLRRSTSSIRYKHDIATLDTHDALAAVMAMRPVTYRGRTDEDQRRFVGFIAEEMQEIAPLLCTYDDGGESGTPNYVTYDRVTAYLVAVVQQQQQKIAALEARIH